MRRATAAAGNTQHGDRDGIEPRGHGSRPGRPEPLADTGLPLASIKYDVARLRDRRSRNQAVDNGIELAWRSPHFVPNQATGRPAPSRNRWTRVGIAAGSLTIALVLAGIAIGASSGRIGQATSEPPGASAVQTSHEPPPLTMLALVEPDVPAATFLAVAYRPERVPTDLLINGSMTASTTVAADSTAAAMHPNGSEDVTHHLATEPVRNARERASRRAGTARAIRTTSATARNTKWTGTFFQP